MNAYKELKLKVYESNMDWDTKCDLITLMESCDDEEFQEVCESVEEIVNEGAYEKLDTLVDVANVGFGTSNLKSAAEYKKEANATKKELDHLKKSLEKFKNATGADETERKKAIEFCEKNIKKLEEHLKDCKKKALIYGGIGAVGTGWGAARLGMKAKKKYDKYKRS